MDLEVRLKIREVKERSQVIEIIRRRHEEWLGRARPEPCTEPATGTACTADSALPVLLYDLGPIDSKSGPF